MAPDGGGVYHPSPPPVPFNFNILEITVISGQDLFPAARAMRTYAVAWVNPNHRIRTQLDSAGHTDPTWNDKFVFRLDDATLHSDTATVTINIYAARPRFIPGPDTLLGTARAILSTLRPSTAARFVALQVRRPTSLRPQGILNIAVALVDPLLCNLPFHSNHGPSAYAYRDIMPAKESSGEELAGDVKTLEPPQPPTDAGLERNGSAGEKERVLLEKKLKKWRSEISAFEENRGWEKEAQTPTAADEEGSSRRRKSKWPRPMSCFDLAGQYADEIGDDSDGSSVGSSRSSSRRL